MIKKVILLSVLFFASPVYAQTASEYTLKVSSKISNQGSGKPPGFSEYKEYPTRALNTLIGYQPNDKIKLDKYGGRMDMHGKFTGFYHVEKLNGRWWSIDPDGYCFIHKGMNNVVMSRSGNAKDGFDNQFSGSKDWAVKTTEMLENLGFNGLGAWSSVEDFKSLPAAIRPMAYTVSMDFMGSYGRKKGAYQQSGHLGYPDDAIFVFDKEFEAYCDTYAKQLAKNKNDKNLYGYFSDNELPFYRKTLDNFLSKKDTTDIGYLSARKWLQEHHISRDSINDIYRNQFLGFVAERYFSQVAKAIKKYDPNHMYIGCRFNGYPKSVPEVLKAAGKYLDAVSINYYNQWTPQVADMQHWGEWAGKPFLITEWYTKGEDSGMGNFAGAGWVVKTQDDRGLFYQNFTLGLMESVNCVGWHWFKYQDNDPANKNVDPSNTDANKGILDIHYKSYTPLTNKMKELNDQAYSLIDFFDKRNKTQ
ncbi:hypothetical protein BDD43_2131 [Mucilaginibacter gracilis]|uniref:Agarase n=1 Tax=Mucilaginibacter gracilis TaxID=423350 RepID=A0A495J1K1_9SPHI|nr:agarase [Mucilaginibacter gracilis]RKR81969.1 hypothetical protein BDD43_2131 [Mucilaginibacter gracilis]